MYHFTNEDTYRVLCATITPAFVCELDRFYDCVTVRTKESNREARVLSMEHDPRNGDFLMVYDSLSRLRHQWQVTYEWELVEALREVCREATWALC